MMSRIPTCVFLALILLCSAPLRFSSHNDRVASLAAATVFVPQEGATEDDVRKADELFAKQQWSQARALYDSIKTSESEAKRHVAKRTVACSLALEDREDALRRALKFRITRSRQFSAGRFYWPQDESRLKALWDYVAHLETTRLLLSNIRERSIQSERDEFQSRLDDQSIKTNFDILRVLDSSNIRPRENWEWGTGYDQIDWWWEGIETSEIYRRYSRYDLGVPLNSDNEPVFIAPPEKYSSEVSRARKILFLLNEIQRLDHSKSKTHTARTLLHLADLKRRLYGPINDPAWSRAIFYYQYADRPSFQEGPDKAGMKPLHKLGDHEARLVANGKLSVITLPGAASPIAIWRKIETTYPESGLVVEANYRRALYCQNRRQYSKAKAIYRQIINDHSNSDQAKRAKLQIKRIESASVLLGQTRMYPAGVKPTLWFATRNASKVDFTARKVDLRAYFVNREDRGEWWDLAYPFNDFLSEWGEEDNDLLNRFTNDKVIATWVQSIPTSELVESHSTLAPLSEAGAYIVEAKIAGQQQSSRGLVVVSGATIVKKQMNDKVMLWAIDSVTGRPLADKTLQLALRKSRDSRKTIRTNSNGLAFYKHEKDTFVFMEIERNDIAFMAIESDHAYSNSEEEEPDHVEFAITDRPLYRPGDELNFRLWTREILNRKYLPTKAGAEVRVHLEGPGYKNRVKTFNLVTDESGSVSKSFRLDKELPLGEYRLEVGRPGVAWTKPAGKFRIEEYKKPEFKVSVTPLAETDTPGKPAKAVVRAEYYTGEPVSNGILKYRIRREDYTASYAPPTKWDWLYGVGFGDNAWAYPWLGDSLPTDSSWEDRWRYYGSRNGNEEWIDEGTAPLNRQGIAELTIDISELAADKEHLIEVHASVTDESRRRIDGKGEIVIARQPFFAFLNLDQGWYQSGEKATVQINTRTANEKGVPTKGQLALYQISSRQGPDGKLVFDRNAIQKVDVQTDQRGQATVQLAFPKEGLYRLGFESDNAQQNSISNEATIWCLGPKFDGKNYRFGELEIIPDKRTYRVGDTARLLINTAHPNAHLMLFDSMENTSFLDVESHSKVIEILIQPHHVPNFFVEATMVKNGETFTEQCEIFVPPVDDMLSVELSPDQPIYRPGQKGSVNIKVTDAQGNPVTGSVALRGYDKSLSYIQSESTSRPKSLVAKRRTRYWNDGVISTHESNWFGVYGRFICPEFHLEDGSEPTSGGLGGGGLSSGGGDPGKPTRRSTSARRGGVNPSTQGYFDKQHKEPEVRSNFADRAIWLPNLQLDKNGTARTEINFPESLTTWRIQGFLATGDKTQVGEAVCEVKTKKDLMVRLQSPRFFTDGDEVVLSAIVRNDLEEDKNVLAELVIPKSIFVPATATDDAIKQDANGNLVLTATKQIKTRESHRFDWHVKVHSSGTATILVKARTDIESDAMQMEFPVYSRNIRESRSHAGFFADKETGQKQIEFDLPANVDASKTKLNLTFAPSPAGAALEAIPFLADYPYGCVEQTMSRFYPTVLAADTLRKLGADLESVAEKIDARGKKPNGSRRRTPVLDPDELERMSNAGLNRLYKFQHADGGWGWWENDDSSRYMTAYVLIGLKAASDSGIKVSESVIRNGVNYLLTSKDQVGSKNPSFTNRNCEQVLIAYALSLGKTGQTAERIHRLTNQIYSNRTSLNPYGRALLTLALHNNGMKKQARTLIGEIINDIRTDAKSDQSWMPTARQEWWRWYNSDVETNAWVLRALIALDSDQQLIHRMANWLVGQRNNGTHWRSTRDSALAIHALVDYLVLMKTKSTGDYSVGIYLNEKHVRDVDVSWQNMLGLENQITFTGEELGAGIHQISLKKDVNGPVYFAFAAQYEVIYDSIPAAQNGGLQVSRRYMRVNPAPIGEPLDGSAVEPTILKPGDQVHVGDIIEVELTISSANNFEYLAFEDPKPAGCEPVRLRSGYTYGNGFASNIELRDSKVVFFVQRLPKGEHIIKYKLRAETPGNFSAMPSKGFAMYTPEIKARTQEARFRITDPKKARGR